MQDIQLTISIDTRARHTTRLVVQCLYDLPPHGGFGTHIHPRKEEAMLSVADVAEYVLSLSDAPDTEPITNPNIQKLLYYAQGFHLAMFGERLFPETIERWTYGPVVPESYRKYKGCRRSAIPYPKGIDVPDFDEPVRKLLNEVYEVYGQYTSWALMNLTHHEPPYVAADERGKISLEVMTSYFKTQLVDGD